MPSRPRAGRLRTSHLAILVVLLAALPLACAELDDASLNEAGHALGGGHLVVEWVDQFGSATFENANALALSDDRINSVGTTLGTLPGQEPLGSSDAFLRATANDGDPLWTVQFGTDAHDSATGVASLADGTSFVGGQTRGAFAGFVNAGGVDAFLSRFDADGNAVWTQQLGTASDDQIQRVALGSTDLFVSGFTSGALDPNNPHFGGRDAFVARFDTAGNLAWLRQLGTDGDEVAPGIAVADDAVYVVGSTTGALPGQTSAGGADAWLRAYSHSGALLWTVQFGTSAFDSATSVAFDGKRIYVSGVTDGALPGHVNTGGRDAFVRTFDPDGIALWTQQFGTHASDHASGIAAELDVVSVSGLTGGTLPAETSAGGIDAFIVRFDAATGRFLAAHQFGTSASDIATGVAAREPHVYVSGSTDGAFPGETSAGMRDAFVAAFEALAPGAGSRRGAP